MFLEGTLTDFGCLGVVPTLFGPMHTLMLVLPQVVLGLVLVARWLTNPLAWREAAGRIWQALRTRPIRTSGFLTMTLVAIWLVWWLLTPLDTRATAPQVPAGSESWPTFHGNIHRSGTTSLTDSDTAPVGKLRWQFHDSLILERRPFACSPAIAGTQVLIGSDNYKLYCVDLETGQPQWTFEAGNPIFSSPAVWNGRVYIGEGLHYTVDAKLYCLDLRDGQVLWSYQTSSHVESSPTVADGKVYFGAGNDGLVCLDAMDGVVKWNYKDAYIAGGPLVVDDRVYFGSGYGSNALYCVSTADGQLLWRKDFAASVWGAPSWADRRLYVAVGNGNFNESDENPFGEVRCLDPSNGSDIWRFTGTKDGVLTSVVVSGRLAVFGSRDGSLYALDTATGKQVWRVCIGAPILSTPTVVAGRVLFGADDGQFRCLDLADGHEIWSYDTTGDMLIIMEDPRIQSSAAVGGGKVVFGAANGNVYCIGAEQSAQAIVVQAQHSSRLMRGADFLTMGLMNLLAQLTGSFGWAIMLTALALKLLLIPLDWRQTIQTRKFQRIQGEIELMRREYVDYRVHRFEVRRLYANANIRSLRTFGTVILQLPVIIIVFLIIQSSAAFVGKEFLWLSDLSSADRLTQLPWLPLFGPELNLLPLMLVGSIWLYSTTLHIGRTKSGLAWHLSWAFVAVGLGFMTYRWSAAILLFTISLLWIDMVKQQLLLRLTLLVRGEGDQR